MAEGEVTVTVEDADVMKRTWRWVMGLSSLCVLLSLSLLGACARSEYGASPPAPAMEAAPAADYYAREEAAPSGGAPPAPKPSMSASLDRSRGAAPARPESTTRSQGSPSAGMASAGKASDGQAGDGQASDGKAQVTPVRRSIYYNGFARMRVTRPTEVLDQVVAMTTQLGGFVERLSSNSVTVRVPVDQFQATFDRIVKLGDVLEKSITAQDVTDALMEIGLRLETSRATRERLIALLAKARTEDEKLQLLAQIQRVTEEIDRLEAQIRTLESLAAFSRITVETVQREALSARSSSDEIAEFQWIQNLSPFRRDVAGWGERLAFEVPDGLVELDNKRMFMTESADGASFWASHRPNKPEGTSAFWLDALKVRLEPEFEKSTVETWGRYQVLRLVDRSESPYVYLVGVAAEGDKLELVEVHYPSSAHEQRYGAKVKAAVEGGSK